MAIPYQKLLVTLDGSELAMQALPHAVELARNNQATLTLLRIVPYITEEIIAVDALPVDWQNLEAEQERLTAEARNALESQAHELRAQGLTVVVAVEVGHAADRIVDYATNHEMDLIVISTHGRTGLQRWLMGSVAGKVASAAPCPILLVRPTGIGD